MSTHNKDLVESSSLFKIGQNYEREKLHDFNETLKAEIRALGFKPHENSDKSGASSGASHKIIADQRIGGKNEVHGVKLEANKTVPPAIHSRIEYAEFISYKTQPTKTNLKFPGCKHVVINLCFSDAVPKPRTDNELEIQKAFKAAPDSSWQVPMYLSTPRVIGTIFNIVLIYLEVI
ncbi:hypothetical protein AYI70_g869 [Smittium culicis]|uniref:PIH1 N-terminal domain-containing protein n=1 Tax=Smittium culicis TaxID=133412 RepID=A0A1R1YF12_9FUNG|nr:hypothetical protein AYI70_g869 [Smittium culicis]